MKNKKITGCHNCPHDSKKSSACISCDIILDDYRHYYTNYILETYDAPAVLQKEIENVTNFGDEKEDELRQLLYTIFDLDFFEILLLKCIINNQSLTDYCDLINDFVDYNNRKKCKMTRFCAFQIRKRMLRKLDKLALLTSGQKKQLKA